MTGARRPKFLIIVLIFLSLFAVTLPSQNVVSAQELAPSQIEDAIGDTVDSQLGELDLSEIEKLLEKLGQNKFFGNSSFLEKVKQILSGEYADNSKSLWGAVLALLLDNMTSLLPLISSVIAIAIFGGMLQGLKPSGGKSISNVIHFVTYGLIVTLLLTSVGQMVTMCSGVITNLRGQMEALFPILLTLMTALGGTASVSVYQPAMALMSGALMSVFSYLLLPIFIFSVVFSVVSNLSSAVKLEKFTSFFTSLFKWLLGLVFTIFTAFLAVQGITAGSIDGISIRAAKYAIRSYVPLVGGYLADGLGLILVSSSLIKNAIGGAGLLLLLATILSPLLQLIIFMLALKFIGAIVEPLGSGQVAGFASSLSKSMTLLIGLIIAVAFVYFIMLSLVMCTANIV